MNFQQMCTPDLRLKSVYEIDFQQMKERGIQGFIFDIDNTLASYDDAVANEKLTQWLNRLGEEGFAAMLVSNNSRDRVKRFAESVRLPYYARALKPFRFFLKRACRDMKLPPERAALVGDQLFTDVMGGRRAGMLTILVDPLTNKDTRLVRIKRRLERRFIESGKERG